MLPERMMTRIPDRMIVVMEDMNDIAYMKYLAEQALSAAQARMPKITGNLARSLSVVFGSNFWGIYFPDKKAWFLEQGTKPFTMNNLAGKTIPMWINDPNGELARQQGRKAKTRVTVDGRKQTLIFRKAANKGERKVAMRRGRLTNVPRSYPGAPGRIGTRSQNGRIAAGNVGVRWRHPGIQGRAYMNEAIEDTADIYGLDVDQVWLIDAATYPTATKS